MNRRMFVSTSAAALFGMVARFPAKGFAAQATPVVSPIPEPLVSDYAKVGPDYDALRTEILAEGREVVDLLFGGEAATLYERLAPEVKAIVTPERLALLVPSLETNRGHFELPQFGAIFDGHLEDRTIEGHFSQGGTNAFTLTAEGNETPSTASPLDGHWAGEIVAGEVKLGIEVTFETVSGKLNGTIDIPDQQLMALPLANVTFKPAVQLGERRVDQALPISLTNRAYLARYAWDDAELAITVGVAPNGLVTALTVAPEWPLPPDPAADYKSAVTYHLPFVGVWWVFWGGDTVLQNYHIETRNQRHAYDILIWKDGGTYTGDATRNESYWAFGQPLFAPAAGTVVSVLDGIPDNTPGVLNPNPHPAGNHVVLQTAEREFVYLAHLQRGSTRVKQGDRIATGDLLGLAGNSGNSSEAHLHIHVQDRADFYAPDAVGLPLRFARYRADGAAVPTGVPVQGQFIERG